jgi:hypothetical protein
LLTLDVRANVTDGFRPPSFFSGRGEAAGEDGATVAVALLELFELAPPKKRVTQRIGPHE